MSSLLKITNNNISVQQEGDIKIFTGTLPSGAINISGNGGSKDNCIISSNQISSPRQSYTNGIFSSKSAIISDNNIYGFKNNGVYLNIGSEDAGIVSNNTISRNDNDVISSFISGFQTLKLRNISNTLTNNSSALVVDNYFSHDTVDNINNWKDAIKSRGTDWVVERNKNQTEEIYLNGDCGVSGIEQGGSGDFVNPIIFYNKSNVKSSTIYYLNNSTNAQEPIPKSIYSETFRPWSQLSTTAPGASLLSVRARATIDQGINDYPIVAQLVTNVGEPGINKTIGGVWTFNINGVANYSAYPSEYISFKICIYTWNGNEQTQPQIGESNEIKWESGANFYKVNVLLNSVTINQGDRVAVQIKAISHSTTVTSGNPYNYIDFYFGGSLISSIEINDSWSETVDDSISYPLSLLSAPSNQPILYFNYSGGVSSRAFAWTVDLKKVLPNNVKLLQIEQDIARIDGFNPTGFAFLLMTKRTTSLITKKTENEVLVGDSIKKLVLNKDDLELFKLNYNSNISTSLVVRIPESNVSLGTAKYKVDPLKITYKW